VGTTLVTVFAATALTSCGAAQDDDVADVATTFASALEARDGAQACSVLARSTRTELEQSAGEPCEKAILEEATRRVGDQVDVDAYGTMAQVRYERDTFFLTRFESGWRVMAAACTPRASADGYDCQVKGG
jgi:hypothetical protein